LDPADWQWHVNNNLDNVSAKCDFGFMVTLLVKFCAVTFTPIRGKLPSTLTAPTYYISHIAHIYMYISGGDTDKALLSVWAENLKSSTQKIKSKTVKANVKSVEVPDIAIFDMCSLPHISLDVCVSG
jgi:hypothetical protein